MDTVPKDQPSIKSLSKNIKSKPLFKCGCIKTYPDYRDSRYEYWEQGTCCKCGDLCCWQCGSGDDGSDDWDTELIVFIK